MKRLTGYYRVRFNEVWTIGFYAEPDDNWRGIGTYSVFKDSDLQEIDEKAIEMDMEKVRMSRRLGK